MSFVHLRVRHLEMANEACGEEKLSTQQDKVLQTRQNGAYDVTKALFVNLPGCDNLK